MSLLTRLISPNLGESKIPVHQFMAALAEYKRGSINGSHVVAAFNLNSTETTALQKFLDNLDNDSINRAKIHDVLLLGERGLYDMNKVKSELGV